MRSLCWVSTATITNSEYKIIIALPWKECLREFAQVTFIRMLPVWYCYVWPDWLYHTFPHYLINGAIFGKIMYEH